MNGVKRKQAGLKQKKSDMDCKEFKNRMIFFIEGDLEKQLAEQFTNHLNTCTSCKILYEQFYSDYNLIATDKITESNPFFYTRVMAGLENEEKQGIIERFFNNKSLILQIASYVVIGFMAISIGYLIANDKSQTNTESFNTNMEETDQQLFAESHNLALAFDDVYIINANETEK